MSKKDLIYLIEFYEDLRRFTKINEDNEDNEDNCKKINQIKIDLIIR